MSARNIKIAEGVAFLVSNAEVLRLSLTAPVYRQMHMRFSPER